MAHTAFIAASLARPEGFTTSLRCWPPRWGSGDALRESPLCHRAYARWSNAPTSSEVPNLPVQLVQ
jgi:hypothetical protein